MTLADHPALFVLLVVAIGAALGILIASAIVKLDRIRTTQRSKGGTKT